ncbi:MAG: hypothetical protein ACJ766_19365 [Thermoleophilaceae bacterium]|jgi:hypothetical protein
MDTANGEHRITLDLSLAEGQALKGWLLQVGNDGGSALDDERLKPALMQLDNALNYVEGVTTVRRELEAAGFHTESMSDEEVADLGRRISDAPLRRAASPA